MGMMHLLRNLRSVLADRADLASEKTFDGKRDLTASFGYKRTLTVLDYRRKAKRNGVANRITKAYPDATWRGQDVELIEDPNPEVNTPFEDSWDQLNKVHKVWARFKRADRLAGFGRYSVIYVHERGALPSSLERELTSLTPENVQYLAAFDEEDAKIERWDTDPKSERFGQPLIYKLKRLVESDKAGGGTSTSVHASRIIHIPGENQLDDDWFGEPVLEAVWNDLDDLEKVKGAGAEAFWLRVHQGYVLNIDPEMAVDTQSEEDLEDEASSFVHGFQRFIRTRGVEVKALGSDVANYAANVASTIGIISATKGIPQRILLGSERGELASTQDDDNWAGRINDRRHEYAEPWIVRPFVTRMIELGVLPAPAANPEPVVALAAGDEEDDTSMAPESTTHEWTIAWPKLQDVSIGDRLDIASKAAKLNKDAGEVIITPQEIRNDFLEMEPLTPEQLKEKQDIEDKKAAEKQAQLDAVNIANGGKPAPVKKPVTKPPVPPEAA